MLKQKIIITTTVLIALGAGFDSVMADSANNLVQMDLKKSTAANTVDVTFYTTGVNNNSVVTRKSANRYVILLPNVNGSSPINPSVGAVKDLITDVSVKNVDDGIGGYTKVIFSTTKPINIKASVKKTAPLTQAQKASKALIAQNQKASTPKPAVQPKKNEPAAAKPAVAAAVNKPAVQQTSKQEPKTNITAVNNSKPAQKPAVQTPAKTQSNSSAAPAKPAAQTPKVSVQTKPAETSKQVKTAAADTNYVPKMQFDNNGARIIDLEPRVDHNQPKQPAVKAEETSIDIVPTVSQEDIVVDEPTVENQPSNSGSKMPLWLIISGLISFVSALVYMFVNFAKNKPIKNTRARTVAPSQKITRGRNRTYQDIIDDKSLNWQERYQKYTQKERKLNPVAPNNDMSYITNLSGKKSVIVAPKNSSVQAEAQNSDTAQVSGLNKIDNNVENTPIAQEDFNKKMQAKISQLEHSLSQTPSSNEPQEIVSKVQSEDDVIISEFEEVKQKAAPKQISLKQAMRNAYSSAKDFVSDNKLQEGSFVNLKDSFLSVNKRHSASSDIAPDLANTGNKYLNNSNEVVKMDKQNENYLLSSLNEYISLLDKEDQTAAAPSIRRTSPAAKSSLSAMTRSGVTNPLAHASNPLRIQKAVTSVNGMVVKSGYSIDNEKGFYIVNIDGLSALVGRIKDSIFILKKFDYDIEEPLQVRKDYGNVYIVRAGGFKCLVDVSKDKMGTLIEI